MRPLFGLAPGGVYHAARLSVRAVRSYRTLSPLLLPKQKRSTLCGTFPQLSLGGHYPPPCLHGARTFLQRIVTNTPAAARPSGPAVYAS